MTYGGGLFAAYYQQRHNDPLPAGYRRVEYLESTGEQWIDTGVYAKSTLKVELDIYYTYTAATSCVLFGGRSRPQRNTFSILFKGGDTNKSVRFDYGNSIVYSDHILDMGKHIILKDRQYNYIDGVLVLTQSTQRFTGAYTTYIWTLNNAGSPLDPSANFAGKGYLCKLWDDDVAVRNLIPCVRISDNKPGMYDLCGSVCPLTNSPFYINSGTGQDFLWGELPQNLPTDGLVFYHTLTTASTTPEVGATMTKSGTLTATVEDGIPCVYFPGAAYMYNSQGFAYSQGTITAWVKPIRQYDSSIFQGHIVSLNDGDPNHIFPPCTFKESDHRVNYNYPDIFSKWHFVATTFNRNDGYRCNCGKLYKEVTVTYAQGNIPYISLGTFLADIDSSRKNFSIVGYVAAARIYNRILSQNELDILAHEFTPTP